MSVWEIVAVALALAYLVLAIRQSLWCWPAAIASTTIYLFLMYRAGLYMESVLQLFYIGIAVYGWRSWSLGRERAPPAGGAHHGLPVTTRPWRWHLLAICGVLLAAVVSGALLTRLSNAALPYLDSFTTWGAILTTWMVARKLLENWIYWFVIDSVSIYLYLNRELYLTAGLFGIYLVMVVIGYRTWRRSMAT